LHQAGSPWSWNKGKTANRSSARSTTQVCSYIRAWKVRNCKYRESGRTRKVRIPLFSI